MHSTLVINYKHKSNKISKVISFVILFLITSTSIVPITNAVSITSDGDILYVGGDGSGNYTHIQDAIENASFGDTIYVYNGIYYEVVVISKQLFLIGEGSENTIIDAKKKGYTVSVSAPNVTISGFTIKNGSYTGHLVNTANLFLDANYSTITGNIFKEADSGIMMDSSHGNIITGNEMKYNHNGIWLLDSHNNEISQNIMKNNSIMGINLMKANNNIITNNIINNNKNMGIYLLKSSYNNIIENEISNSSKGIFLNSLEESGVIQGNIISKNNFLNNDDSDADFMLGSGFQKRNIWRENYWNQSHIFPKIIFGVKWLNPQIFPFPFWIVPLFQVDWHPAQEPYEIVP